MSTNYIITLFLYIVHKKASPCSSPSPIVIRGTSHSFLHSLHLSHEKSPAGTKPTGLPMLKANICLFALICGGDGENRTPVQERRYQDFAERSLCLDLRFRQTQTTAIHPISMRFPFQASENWPSGIPLLAPYPLTREISRQGLALSG